MWALVLGIAGIAGVVGAARPAVAGGLPRYVSSTGSDDNDGTYAAPWRTIAKGLASLDPGNTLYVRGGTYLEDIRSVHIRPGTAASPVTVTAYPGERPVLQGLLWLHRPSYWTFDGLNVTWNPATDRSSDHMVKLTNGVGWSFKNAEIWGAQSYAGLLVAGTIQGEPSQWSVTGNCIHDTYPTNHVNQDHLIYANTGTTAGPGLIEHNLLFNAVNGEGVKLGGSEPTSGGAANVTVTHNTIFKTAQNVLVAWASHDNAVYGNLLDGVRPGYANVRGYELVGSGNRVNGNVGVAARTFLLDDPGYLGIADAGDNQMITDPRFDSVGSCQGFHAANVAPGIGR